MSYKKAIPPVKIENNILIGEEESIEDNCTSIGELLLNAFKTKPDLIGQVDALTGKQNTCRQMRERSVKCALWLKKQGIKPGDVVAICTHNQLEAYIPFLASMYIGALSNPWNESSGLNTMEAFLKITTPKVIFINGDRATTALEATTKLGLSTKIVVFDEVDGFESLESILSGQFDEAEIEGFTCVERNARDTVVLLFSSGTTGASKAVECVQALFTAPATLHAPIQKPGNIGLWFGSLSWITSTILTVRTILSYGTAIKFAGFDSDKVCQVIEKYKVTWMLIETGVCNRMVKSGAMAKYDISSLKQIVFGGSAIKPDFHESIVKIVAPDTLLLPVYGMTEVGSIVCQRGPTKIGSSGIVAKRTSLKFADLETGKSLGSNKRGEICIKSLSMMNGYYRNPESTKNAFDEDGWFHTGDVGYYDEDGYVFVVDRIKELIKYKGHHVSPIEIESLLQSHPAVCESAVVSLAHRFDGQYPIAFVKQMPGAKVTKEELVQLVAANVDDHKQLRGGVVFLDEMPHLANGKVDRKELRNMAKVYETT